MTGPGTTQWLELTDKNAEAVLPAPCPILGTSVSLPAEGKPAAGAFSLEKILKGKPAKAKSPAGPPRGLAMPLAPRALGAQPAFCVPGVGGLAAAAQNPFCAGVGGAEKARQRGGSGR